MFSISSSSALPSRTSNQRRPIWECGYIAHSFGCSAAEQYHNRLFRMDSRSIVWSVEPVGNLRALVASSTDYRGQAWTIDYMAKDTGPVRVIPQGIWVSQSRMDHAPELHRPIFFVRRDRGDIGLPLIDAAEGHCESLRDAEETVLVGPGHTTQIHIGWHGYAPWNSPYMIQSQAQRRRGGFITRLETFVTYVAEVVKEFMEEVKNHPFNSSHTKWRIGNGGITPRDVTLIGVVEVSKGLWMPILQLNGGFTRSVALY